MKRPTLSKKIDQLIYRNHKSATTNVIGCLVLHAIRSEIFERFQRAYVGMANKESSELGNLPTSPMAERARTCETTGERLRNRELAYGFDLDYKNDPPTLVPCTWSKNYAIGLYGRIGLQCYNLQNGTNLKFKRLEKHSTKRTGRYSSVYITLDATDPATGSVCSFQTQFSNAGSHLRLRARITWLTFAARIKQIPNEPIDDDWDEDTPGINEFYKVPLPKWFSDERGSKKYYVPESELHDNDWLQLLMEVAFFSKANRRLDAYLPLELNSVVVETLEDEPRDKLKADNAIFYISYKCCADPCSTPLAGDHRAVVRKTMDGKPGHMCLEVAFTKEQNKNEEE
ncbi:UPF0725 protein At5g63820-like isoform X2 [Raphanus sativus]|uniref:UPF0725 protein At5g63820-like isoform X2 n=1 Tax=Raphanus sativus TaxID=3726 RepID=A0A9W3C8B5_RAPSA|nr:UPF0725 protein At5g63820-like isoform X2 [Raphanus sativus]